MQSSKSHKSHTLVQISKGHDKQVPDKWVKDVHTVNDIRSTRADMESLGHYFVRVSVANVQGVLT